MKIEYGSIKKTKKAAFIRHMMINAKVSENNLIAEDLRLYFESRPEVIAAYLYGSRAAGTAGRSSDVDIAIHTHAFQTLQESFHAKLGYQRELSDIIKINSDIVFLQEAGELLAYQILKHGKLLFERDRQTHRAFVARRMIQCLDFQFLQTRMQKGMIRAMREEIHGQ